MSGSTRAPGAFAHSTTHRVTSFEGLVGGSEALRRVFSLIEKVAPSDSAVLITGESGTGKELVAPRDPPAQQPQRAHAFVPVNCGAIPETLIESSSLGHVRGAFTGAVSDRPASSGRQTAETIFLDEVGELPLACRFDCCGCCRITRSRRWRDHVATADVRVVAADQSPSRAHGSRRGASARISTIG